MQFHIQPDPVEKLAQMGSVTDFEPAGDRPLREGPPTCYRPAGAAADPLAGLRSSISLVTTPRGPKPVLKTMVTTACERNCFYCAFRAGRSRTRRITFTPDELASGFSQLQQARLVDGLFLSSGIIGGGASAQDKLIDTAEILRGRLRYRGYIHLKVMPGAEYDQVRRAMQLADRVSINLEGPTPQRLQALAPKKDFWQELFQRLQWIHHIRQDERLRTSIVTQFVVGAVDDTDLELLTLGEKLYRQLGLRRTYFSAFAPVQQTPFEHLLPASKVRERRLYQASFLLRDYDWDVEELSFLADQNLRLDVDPKQAWADQYLRQDPVDLVRAERRELLRVPGIGPKSADAILRARRRGGLTQLAHLRAIGVPAPERAADYILLNGRRPARQLPLFER